MNRREFLTSGAAALGAAAVGGCATTGGRSAPLPSITNGAETEWAALRKQFELPPSKLHFSGFFLACVPDVVKAAIERHRAGLDADAVAYWMANHSRCEREVRRAAGEYLGVNGDKEIALTDSTTMGLGLLYSGIKIRPDQEILSSEHDHPATREALEHKARRSGATLSLIKLYDTAASIGADQVVDTIRGNIKPATRVLAVTWVHSCSGLKMPVARIAELVREANAGRGEADRLLFCVDGVHGHGIENATIPEMGCDFFAAGTHKWMLGPRGTGILWGRGDAWPQVDPAIANFSPGDGPGPLHTPGGFHTFESRWAADEAFKLHLHVGKARVTERLHLLNRRIREGLAAMPHVTLHTPMSEELSAGINCFEVRGLSVDEVADRLNARGVIATASPYTPSYARLAACIWNTPDEVDAALREVERLRA